jgi:hypothetical protein
MILINMLQYAYLSGNPKYSQQSRTKLTYHHTIFEVCLERQYSPLDKLDHGLPIGRLHLPCLHTWVIVGDWYYLMQFL